VWFSVDDGATQPFAVDTSGDYALMWPSGFVTDATTADCDTLSAAFNTVGYYAVQVSCTAVVGSTTVTGTYSVGCNPTPGGQQQGFPHLPSEDNLDVLFTGTMIDNGVPTKVTNLDLDYYSAMYGTPMVVRGSPCTFGVRGFVGIPPLLVFGTNWSTTGGDPVWKTQWLSYYGLDYTYFTVPLISTLGSLNCCFQSAGPVSISCASWPNPYECGGDNIYVADPVPTRTDTLIYVQPYMYSPVTGRLVKLNSGQPLALSIPPDQVDYPFTPSPNLVHNASGAYAAYLVGYALARSAGSLYPSGLGTEVATTLILCQCPHGTIGDWGNTAAFYPDLNYAIGAGEVETRRRGANFNFGAMMYEAGYPYGAALEIGVFEGKLYHDLQMQYSIACGWVWAQRYCGSLTSSPKSPVFEPIPTIPNTTIFN
jgi:hypothetical protein